MHCALKKMRERGRASQRDSCCKFQKRDGSRASSLRPESKLRRQRKTAPIHDHEKPRGTGRSTRIRLKTDTKEVICATEIAYVMHDLIIGVLRKDASKAEPVAPKHRGHGHRRTPRTRRGCPRPRRRLCNIENKRMFNLSSSKIDVCSGLYLLPLQS